MAYVYFGYGFLSFAILLVIAAVMLAIRDDFRSYVAHRGAKEAVIELTKAFKEMLSEAEKNPKKDKRCPVDVSDELFPKRDKKWKFVKAIPKARVDNFKGL